MLGTNVDVPDKEPKTPKPKPDPNVWTGTDGNNLISGSATKDYLEYHGLGGNDIILGGPGDNLIDGGDGDDILYGGGGTDILLGGKGNDILTGGSGTANDILTGGPGADTFRFSSSGGGINKITDFNAAEGDKIYLINNAIQNSGQFRNIWRFKDRGLSYNQSSGALTLTNPFDNFATSVVCYLQPNLGNGFIPNRDVIMDYYPS
jgi:Ca2+-binding RTX toxin-like protein